MSASKALETLLVCTCSTRSALSSGMDDDFIGDKVVTAPLLKEVSEVPTSRVYKCDLTIWPKISIYLSNCR
jgi:hypothetical protein